jgi:LPS O-antigen subunit length determinant protein (WzzB/FepE family)
LRRTLYSGLVVIAGVTLAFAAVAVSLALNG